MPDAADEAQKREADNLAAALAGLRLPAPGEQIKDASGAVVCIECGEPIPEKRLAAEPKACRCTACQEEEDAANA